MDEGFSYGPIDTMPEGYAAFPAGAEDGQVGVPIHPIDDESAQTGAHPRAPGGPPEHAGYHSPQPVFDVYQPPPTTPHWARPQPPPMHQQAVGADADPPSHLGLSLLALGLGIGLGAKQGGLAGAAAGGLLAGAVVNGYHSFTSYRMGTEAGDKEGSVAALYGLVGAVGGGWLWMKYVHGGARLAENPTRKSTEWGGERCAIRRAGP